jgi:hypothetical protein
MSDDICTVRRPKDAWRASMAASEDESQRTIFRSSAEISAFRLQLFRNRNRLPEKTIQN